MDLAKGIVFGGLLVTISFSNGELVAIVSQGDIVS